MHVTETMIRPGKGCRLFVRYCHASAATPRTLVVLHGACEHGERYLAFARWLTQHRWNVVIPDLRGHGRSGGVRTHVRDFADYLRDLDAVRSHFSLQAEQTALFGHSTGGLVSILFAEEHPQAVSAVALSSPLLALKVPVPFRTIALGRILSFFAPQTRFRSRVKPTDSTRNPVLREIRLHDPLTERSVTAGWYFSMQRAIRQAWKDAGKFAAPLLILQAGQDHVVDSQAPVRWMEKIASRDSLFHLRGDDYHELLNEPDWEETAHFLGDWLANRLPGSAAAGQGSFGA